MPNKKNFSFFLKVVVFFVIASSVFSVRTVVNVCAEENSVKTQSAAKTSPASLAEANSLSPAVQASTPYFTNSQGVFDPNAGTHEWHVDMGEGVKVFSDQASADAYAKEKMTKFATPYPELQKAAQAKADAESEARKAQMDAKMQAEVDKAMKEGYIVNINGVEYGRPDSFTARAKSREYAYVDSHGGLYGFGDEDGNPVTLDQFYQGVIKINTRMLEQNRKWAQEMSRHATPEERKINEPAFAEAEQMWINAMKEAQLKYKEMAATLKKTVPYDYKILDENKGKMPADYWDTRPALDLEPLDLSGYIFSPNGAMIAPSGDLVTPAGDIKAPESANTETQNVGLSNIFSNAPEAEKVEDKVAYSSVTKEKKKIEDAIEKKINETYARSYKALVSLESKNK